MGHRSCMMVMGQFLCVNQWVMGHCLWPIACCDCRAIWLGCEETSAKLLASVFPMRLLCTSSYEKFLALSRKWYKI